MTYGFEPLSDTPTQDETSRAILGFLLASRDYHARSVGRGDQDGLRIDALAKRTDKLFRKAICAIDRLCEHESMLHRNGTLIEKFLPVLAEHYRSQGEGEPLEPTQAESLSSLWTSLTGEPLTPGQIEALARPPNAGNGHERRGAAWRAKHRLGKLLQLGPEQVNKIVKRRTPESPVFWNPSAQSQKRGHSEAIEYFFGEVLSRAFEPEAWGGRITECRVRGIELGVDGSAQTQTGNAVLEVDASKVPFNELRIDCRSHVPAERIPRFHQPENWRGPAGECSWCGATLDPVLGY